MSVTPWYRQFWPWFLIAVPGTAVLGGLVTIWIAIGARPALVVDDYGRIEELTLAGRAADARAAELGLRARIRLDGRFATVTFAPPERPDVLPDSLLLTLRHPTDPGADRELMLVRVAENDYRVAAGYRVMTPMYAQLTPAGYGHAWRLRGRLNGNGETWVGGDE